MVAILTFSFDAKGSGIQFEESVYNVTSDTVNQHGNRISDKPEDQQRTGNLDHNLVAARQRSAEPLEEPSRSSASIDGTNWKAMNTPDTQTALATITATDATNTYHWRLSGSPFPYYRVSWTGTGTMAAKVSRLKFSGQVT